MAINFLKVLSRDAFTFQRRKAENTSCEEQMNKIRYLSIRFDFIQNELTVLYCGSKSGFKGIIFGQRPRRGKARSDGDRREKSYSAYGADYLILGALLYSLGIPAEKAKAIRQQRDPSMLHGLREGATPAHWPYHVC